MASLCSPVVSWGFPVDCSMCPGTFGVLSLPANRQCTMRALVCPGSFPLYNHAVMLADSCVRLLTMRNLSFSLIQSTMQPN